MPVMGLLTPSLLAPVTGRPPIEDVSSAVEPRPPMAVPGTPRRTPPAPTTNPPPPPAVPGGRLPWLVLRAV